MSERILSMETAPKDGTIVRLAYNGDLLPDQFWWERGKWRTFLLGMTRRLAAYYDGEPEGWPLPKLA